MTTKQGGISPNDFAGTLADFVAAKTKEDSAAGTRRGIMARFEKLGAHKQGLNLFLKLRNMEPADAELTLTSALRYCRFAQLQIGDQATLFPASDDAGAPSTRAAKGLTEALAYEEGYGAGRGGRSRGDHRFEAGTPMHAKFDEGWIDGQTSLAMEMGEDLPADGSALRRKAKKKDGRDGAEQREAKPSGGRRARGVAGQRALRRAAREEAGTY
ncbi:MAG: hypothetical protein K2X74_00630 [Acetobacteraceae bacterium]|nr:hypothetical protein [Acetobacteraceae bacterium]